MKTTSKTNDWFGEIGWLADNFKKFTVDELRILVMGANNKPMPEPASKLGQCPPIRAKGRTHRAVTGIHQKQVARE